MKPCRCLLGELDDRAFLEQVQDYLASMPAENKAPPEVYDARLAVCKACGKLVNGFCALCGCVVELRAAKRVMGCPERKWEAMRTENGA